MEDNDIMRESCVKGGLHELIYDKDSHIIECKKCNLVWLSKEYYSDNHNPKDCSSNKSSSEGRKTL